MPPKPWAPPREAEPLACPRSRGHRSWNAAQKGPWLPSHTRHPGCWTGEGGGVQGRRVWGIVPCPAQPPPPLGFSIPTRAGPRGASALCLPPGFWHVSAEAPRAAPEASPTPHSPGRAPRPASGAGPPVRRPRLCPLADAGAKRESPAPGAAAA